MSNLNKQDIECRTVIEEDKVYVFTPASSNEVLYLRDYMRYTTIICMNTSYAGIVQLPSVAEAKGIAYSIRVDDASNATTVRDADDSVAWSDITLDATDENVTVESDGHAWNQTVADYS